MKGPDPFTEIVGAFVEASSELRIHRTRVLLSLIGVALAVAAITSVVGLGAVAQQATQESLERSGGRPASLFVSVFSSQAGGQSEQDKPSDAVSTIMQRYSIDWWSRVGNAPLPVQFVDGVAPVDSTIVDPDYGTMHRVAISQGRWLSDADASRLAPAVVINEVLWNRLGSPDLRTHPTVDLATFTPAIGVIVGVVPSGSFETYPTMFLLTDSVSPLLTTTDRANLSPRYETWVPPGIAGDLAPLIKRDLAAALGSTWTVQVDRQDFQVSAGEDPLLPFKLVVGGVAALVLLLGALGLVNISLVTVKYRIREIGIRRSFGATAARIFFAVLMESVVATALAGVVGVFLAVVLVKNPTVIEFVGQGVTDLPGFPLEAALIGLGCAVAVGAIAGLLPALVAVRVKVIDAIRY